ncbi:MAG: DNA repair protein RecO [Beijerinckiaceae bacterium]|nr:DNA repair protein RecO [Beijerinckiaceae bacterium]
MEWRDDGLIIGARKHGETSVILEVMTREHGRHLGLVKGGRSKRMQPLLQPGNSVEVTWRARLEEHLGFYAVEATKLRTGDLMRKPAALHGLNLMTTLLRLLAEREPHGGLYERSMILIDGLDDPVSAPSQLVMFELAVLADCGFGVDLTECAATGSRDDLIYVSPKSSRAVSREAGEPYKDRLFRLPPFLRHGRANHISRDDLRDGFDLAGYFLSRNLFAPRGLGLPDAHDAYVAMLMKGD